MRGLLLNKPEAVGLLRGNPFEGHPPRFVRTPVRAFQTRTTPSQAPLSTSSSAPAKATALTSAGCSRQA